MNPGNFKNPKLGWALVSIAGPMSNLVTATVLSIPLRFQGFSGTIFGDLLITIIILNVILMVFNLIPIPPLDGSKVLYAFLPDTVDIRQLETYGPILLLGLIFLGRGILASFIIPVISGVLSVLGVGFVF